MRKPKVAFIVTALNSGGLENYLLRFLKYESNKLEATVYCRANFIGDLKSDYLDANVRIIPFKLGYYNPVDYMSFYRELKKQNYSTVVDFCGIVSGLTLLTAKIAGIPNRIVFYRNSSDRFLRDVFRNIYAEAMKIMIKSFATQILANSYAGLNFYHQDYLSGGNEYDVIYNGIDAGLFLTETNNLREELHISKESYVIGHLGRYNEAKNHETIIQVAEILCKRYSRITFLICGANVDTVFQERVNKIGLHNQIKLLGYRKDVAKILNSMDCFYFPSITEGQPNALIEAMIVGLPFIASDILPIQETVNKDFHRYLIPPRSVDIAVEKLTQMYRGETNFSLQEWAVNHFRPDYWFDRFFNKL